MSILCRLCLPKSKLARVALCLAIVIVGGLALYFLTYGRPDDYLSARLNEIELSLGEVPSSFGIEVIDTYQVSGRESRRNGYGVYVSGFSPLFAEHGIYQNILVRTATYDAEGALSAPLESEVALVKDKAGNCDTVRMQRDEDGMTTFARGSSRVPFADIGRVARYTTTLSDGAGTSLPSPCQLLLNPCIASIKNAPGRMTPAEIRTWRITRHPDEQGMRVYEAGCPNNDFMGWYKLKLYFSPEHGHALARSEFIQLHLLRRGKPAKTIYSVDAWQQLPSGRFVPARMSYSYVSGAGFNESLSREVTVAQIGDVDPATFDITQIPEFQQAAAAEAGSVRMPPVE